MKKIILTIIALCFIIGTWFLYSEIYSAESQYTDEVSFKIEAGESVSALALKLEEQQVVRHAWLFKKYLSWKNLDRTIRQGSFTVKSPITLARVVEALENPSVNERNITIIPGWDLRDIANYFEEEGIVSSTKFYEVVGKPSLNHSQVGYAVSFKDPELKVQQDKLSHVSYEGYLAPETYRVYRDATIEEILQKLMKHRNSQFSDQMYEDIEKSGRTVYEIITMASIIEREVRSEKDKHLVSDIFWKRHDINMGLQSCATVHYVTGKKGDWQVTAEEKESLSPWNTYKYAGLPLGPISNPNLDSIMAAIYPEPNDYWYFLTTLDTGEVKYAETLEGHNINKQKYLR